MHSATVLLPPVSPVRAQQSALVGLVMGLQQSVVLVVEVLSTVIAVGSVEGTDHDCSVDVVTGEYIAHTSGPA